MHYPNPRLGLVIGLNRAAPLLMLPVPLVTGVASLALQLEYVTQIEQEVERQHLENLSLYPNPSSYPFPPERHHLQP